MAVMSSQRGTMSRISSTSFDPSAGTYIMYGHCSAPPHCSDLDQYTHLLPYVRVRLEDSVSAQISWFASPRASTEPLLQTEMMMMLCWIGSDFNNSKLAVSVPVSGFHGWNDTDVRRQEVLQGQFAACDPKRHPEAQPAIAEETRDFWRAREYSPSPQAFHFYHNAETYW